jgi:hypothetical protein
LTFVVADNGPGIPLADQERVFLPFQQGAQDARGVGLGLAIARQWVDRMGGELRLESRPGQGCRFSFSIQCALAPEAPVMDDAVPVVTRIENADLQATLQAMIRQGQVSDIVAWAQALDCTDPERQDYVARVRQAALHLDFPTLEKLASSSNDKGNSDQEKSGQVVVRSQGGSLSKASAASASTGREK